MLKTPFGEIKIFKNRNEIEYVAEVYNTDIDAIKEKPLAGCYRITIDFEENDTIICQLSSDNSLIEVKSECETGEDYICCHIEKDNIKLDVKSYLGVIEHAQTEITNAVNYSGFSLEHLLINYEWNKK